MSPNNDAPCFPDESDTFVETTSDVESPMTRDDRGEWLQGWNKYILDLESFLWNQDLDDDEYPRPAGTIIRLALDHAEQCRDKGLPPPTDLIRDADGGIILERTEGNESERFHVWDDGEIDYRQYKDGRVVWREVVAAAAQS